MKQNIFLLERLLPSLVSANKFFGKWLMMRRLEAIEHLPNNEDLINSIWKKCAIIFLLIQKSQLLRKKTSSILESLPKNNWMTFLDNLTSLNQNIQPIGLLKILVLELISKEKAFKPFWTAALKDISEKLWSPTEIDSLDLPSTLLISLSPSQEVKLPLLTMIKTNPLNKNLPKTSFQLSTSTVVAKWVEENTVPQVQKAMRVRIYPTMEQKKILNEWFNTSNYVYNKTVESIHNGSRINFQELRDSLVTNNTKKFNEEDIKQSNVIKELHNLKKKAISSDEKKEIENKINEEKYKLRELRKKLQSSKNPNITEWEINTPKDIRAGAVDDVVKAYKTGFANLKNGNIRYFHLNYKKKEKNKASMVVSKKMVSIKDNKLILSKNTLKENSEFKIKEKLDKKFQITADSRILMENKKYYIIVPIDVKIQEKVKPVQYCGIDPGIRTFITSFQNDGKVEYKHQRILIDKLNKQIYYLKSKRLNNKRKALTKREFKKENLINEIHWKTINHLVSNNDVIFYGDIKSHNIVNGGKNKRLNKDFNDLKFYQFKQRLEYKALINGKLVVKVNEAYTSKTCSNCGTINDPKNSEIYSCSCCKRSIGRDENAAKNILLKGF
jgi:putative transposase